MPAPLQVTDHAIVSLGSWPDWIAAVGTSLAFMIAAVTYFRSVRDASEAQARLVFARIEEIHFYSPGDEGATLLGEAEISGGEGLALLRGADGLPTRVQALHPVVRAVVRIHNGSDELVGPGKIQLYNDGFKRMFDRVSMFHGAIEPHSDYFAELHVINPHHPSQPSVSTVLIFRDSSNRWWKRAGFDPIERIHDDPNNMQDTPAERAERVKNLAILGDGALKIKPLLKPSMKVRWHRLVRRLHGKNPVP